MGHIYNWMGHSGSEPGASSILVEDTVTREARKIATAYFKKCGHTVTADNDNMSLVQRINASTDKNALIVEWHANVGGGTGTEVWYSKYDSGLGKKIATAMAKSVTKFGLTDRGAKNSKTNRYGRLGILDDPIPTAVLVELIFLDSKNDTVIWNKNKTAIVEAMCKAMLDTARWKSTVVSKPVTKPVSKPAPVKPKPKSAPAKPSVTQLKVDGQFGKTTAKRLQQYLKTTADGIISHQYKQKYNQNIYAAQFDKSLIGSNVVVALQKLLKVEADGLCGKATIVALQKRMGTTADGFISPISDCVKELQRRLNKNKL